MSLGFPELSLGKDLSLFLRDTLKKEYSLPKKAGFEVRAR
jgi:hypothetical protein